MSSETRTPSGSKPRRTLVIAAALAAFALATGGAVGYFSSDSWSDEAVSSAGFPGLPGGDWASTTSADGQQPTQSDVPTETTTQDSRSTAASRSEVRVTSRPSATVAERSSETTDPTTARVSPSASASSPTLTTSAPSPTPTST